MKREKEGKRPAVRLAVGILLIVLAVLAGCGLIWMRGNLAKRGASPESARSFSGSGLSPCGDRPVEPSCYAGQVIVGANRGAYYEFSIFPKASVLQYPPRGARGDLPPEGAAFAVSLSHGGAASTQAPAPPPPLPAPHRGGLPQIAGGAEAQPWGALRIFDEEGLPSDAKFSPPDLFMRSCAEIEAIRVDASAQTLSRTERDQLKPSSDRMAIVVDQKLNPISRITP
jgi:hypothetical protein